MSSLSIRLQVLTVLLSASAALAGVGGGTMGGGLKGEYFNNAELKGKPAFSRHDVRVEFDWGTLEKPGGSRHQSGFRDIGTDNYSVRWTGGLLSQFSETYTFKVTADDGARLFIRAKGDANWTPVLDGWGEAGTKTGTFELKKDAEYELKLEYREVGGPATCSLHWSSPSTPEEVIEPLSPVGLNAETHKDEWFTDTVKGGRDEFAAADRDENRDTWPARDTNGWPMGDFSQILWEGRPPLDVAGTYLLKFEGQAEVNSSFGDGMFFVDGMDYGNKLPSGTGYDSETNTTTAQVVIRPENTGIFSLIFRETQRTHKSDVNSGLTNVRFFSPIEKGGGTPYDGTDEWRPDSLALYAPFTTLRMLTANFVTVTSWEAHPESWKEINPPSPHHAVHDYYPRNFARVGGNYALQCSMWQLRGFPSWERQVEIANLTGKDLYITIPYKVNDDYVTKLAQLIRYGSDGVNPYTSTQADPVFAPLNSNLKVCIEWSNEMWNFGFRNFFDLLTETRAILEKADHPDRAILTYDDPDVSPRGDGGFNSEVPMMYRLLALKSKRAGDIFRTVFGEADKPFNRVRPLLMGQYDNGATYVDALHMLDCWFNNADGKQHVENPQPIRSYLWGGGGASYYGASNSLGTQDQIVFANAGFEESAPAAVAPAAKAGARPAPASAGWTFSGDASIQQAGDGKAAVMNGIGEISQVVQFTKPGIYALQFTASGGNTLDVFAGNDKLNPGNAPDIAPPGFDGTPIGTGDKPTKIYTLPFPVAKAGPVTIRVAGREDGKSAVLDAFEIHDSDAIYAGTIPFFNVGRSHEDLFQAEANFFTPYGLQFVVYEGGWAVFSSPEGGGSDMSTPLNKLIKYADPRTKDVNYLSGRLFQQAGGNIYCFGSFGQWSKTHNATKEPIWQSFVKLADTLPPMVSNGFQLPATLTMTATSARMRAGDSQIDPWGWTSWNIISPATSKYQVVVSSSEGEATLELQIDGLTVAKGPAGTDLTYSANLTAGLHNVTVRALEGGVAVTGVAVSMPDGPAVPTLESVAQSGADLVVTWSAPTSGPPADGYIIRYGTAPSTYSKTIEVGKVTSAKLPDLEHAKDYYVSIAAKSGVMKSVGSNELSAFYAMPGKPYWRTVDDRDPLITYSTGATGWSQFGDHRNVMKTNTYSEKSGATAAFNFKGTKVRFITHARPDYGIVEIYLDGKNVGTVDTSLKDEFQFIAYESPDLPPGEHTIEVIVTGNHSKENGSPNIIIDAFSYLSDGK